MLRRSRTPFLVLVVVLAALIAAGVARADDTVAPTTDVTTPAPGAADVFAGTGAWIDLFDGALWAAPERTIAKLSVRGVHTLYIETSNSSQAVAIHRPLLTARFITAAHARGMKIVAWYLPTLTRPARDRVRTAAAIRFRTATGQGFDGFALDIESSKVRSVPARTARVLALSASIRTTAGAGYPLGAIIPSPRGMELNRRFWPQFPYVELATTYDAWMPMVYTSYHDVGPAKTLASSLRAIDLLQAATATSIPIHLVGGIANALDARESAAFVRAARTRGVSGVSFYDVPTMGTEDWRALTAFRSTMTPTSAPDAAATATLTP